MMPTTSETPRTAATVQAEITQREERLHALRSEAEAAAARYAAAQTERTQLLGAGAPAEEVVALNRELATLREAMDGYGDARAQVEREVRALRREHARLHVPEAVAAAITKVREMDGVLRECARTVRPLMPALDAAVAEVNRAELQARAASGGDTAGRPLRALVDGGGAALPALLEAARVVLHYTDTQARVRARNRPATPLPVGEAPPPPADVSA